MTHINEFGGARPLSPLQFTSVHHSFNITEENDMFRSHDSISTTSREIRAMINEAERFLKDASTTTAGNATELQRRGMELLSCSIARAHELEHNAIHSIKDVATSTNKMAHANPWRLAAVSGLVGAGIGLLLGVAISRD